MLTDGTFTELMLAVAPSFWGVFVSSLIFSLSALVGATLLGVLIMDFMVSYGRVAAYVGFCVPLAAFALLGFLTVASGWNAPTVQPGVVPGALAGDVAGLLVAWAAFRSGAARLRGS